MKYSISLAILLFSTSLLARESFRAAKNENADRTPSATSFVNTNIPTLNTKESEATLTTTEENTKVQTKKAEKPARD